LEVSDGQASCTTDVQIGGNFEFERMKIALIDTPGFDDTERSDAEILQIIMAFLEAL
jgi:GTPase Era involved in 16S rRNA processing